MLAFAAWAPRSHAYDLIADMKTALRHHAGSRPPTAKHSSAAETGRGASVSPRRIGSHHDRRSYASPERKSQAPCGFKSRRAVPGRKVALEPHFRHPHALL